MAYRILNKTRKKTASNDARQKTVWLSISGRMEEVSGSSTWSPTRIQRGSTTRHYISKETKSTAARGRQTEWLAQACEYTSEPFSDERHKIRYGKTKLPFVGTNVPNRTKICNEPLATGPLDVGLHYGWEVFVVCFVCLLQAKNKITKIHRKFPKNLLKKTQKKTKKAFVFPPRCTHSLWKTKYWEKWVVLK